MMTGLVQAVYKIFRNRFSAMNINEQQPLLWHSARAFAAVSA
jgi:hypothetical protein